MTFKLSALKNPKVLQTVIFMLVLLVLSGIFFKMSFDLWEKNNKLKTDVTNNKVEIAKAKAIETGLRTLSNEINTLEEKLSQLQENLFFNTEDLLIYLNQYADATGISLSSIEPISEPEKIKIEKDKKEPPLIPDFILFPVELKIKCDYHQLLRFLSRIERAKKMIVVDNLRIEANSQDIWNHDIMITLKAPILNLRQTGKK